MQLQEIDLSPADTFVFLHIPKTGGVTLTRHISLLVSQPACIVYHTEDFWI
jgi:hypothetical protein